MLKRTAWLAALALSYAWPAPAQDEPAGEDGSEIVVTGRPEPPTREEVYEQARELSRVGPFQMDEEPLARFEGRLCIEIAGLKASSAEVMAERIRENAERLKVRLAGRRCMPNFLVAFVQDGQPLLEKVAETRRKSFCTLPEEEQAELLADDAPVRVWTQRVAIGDTAHVWKCRWDLPSPDNKAMFLPFYWDIISTLVVFDREAAGEMSLLQLADYATMRGLSHVRPADGTERMPTILSLFTEGARQPAELTEFDLGYLLSLYKGKPVERASTNLMSVRWFADKVAEEAPAP